MFFLWTILCISYYVNNNKKGNKNGMNCLEFACFRMSYIESMEVFSFVCLLRGKRKRRKKSIFMYLMKTCPKISCLWVEKGWITTSAFTCLIWEILPSIQSNNGCSKVSDETGMSIFFQQQNKFPSVLQHLECTENWLLLGLKQHLPEYSLV